MKNKKFKRNHFITIIVLIISIWTALSFINFIIEKKQLKNKQMYVQECLQKLKKFNYTDNQKLYACTCRHDYLYSKYGDEIYNEKFIIPSKEDSTKVIECLVEALKVDTIIDSESLIDNIN